MAARVKTSLGLTGDYSSGVVFHASTVKTVEYIEAPLWSPPRQL